MTESATAVGAGPEILKAKLKLKHELDALVAQFERDSLALPPGELTLKQWSHRALELAKRLRASEAQGTNKLLRPLQRFQVRLREMRVARRRYMAERDQLGLAPPRDAMWVDVPVALPRHRLADAIHAQLDVSGDIGTESRTSPVDPSSNVASEEQSPLLTMSDRGPEAVELAPHELMDSQPTEYCVDLREDNARPAPIVRDLPGAAYQRHSTRVDPIMAIEGRLALPDSFDRAREIARQWLRKKHLKIPADSPDSFDIESENKGNRAIAVDWPGVWALQAETADASMPGRRWRVEMVLVEAQPTPAVSVTLTAISSANQPAPQPSIPGLVSQLIEEIGLLDTDAGEQLFAGATLVNDMQALKHMLTSLQSRTRRRPALVLSTYSKEGRSATLLDPIGLANRLRGVAKVYVLSREMSWSLTDALSKRFAVAGASVRLFRPGFTPDDEPGHHPAWGPDALRAQGLSLSSLSAMFLREAADVSLRALEREDAIPPFDRVREQVLRRQIEEARRLALPADVGGKRNEHEVQALEKALQDEEALRLMFEEDNEKQRQELQRIRGERDQLRDERDTLRARTYYLEDRVRYLLPSQQDDLGAIAKSFPDSWDDLEAWCEQHLGNNVALTTKAIRAARDSAYLDVPFAYEVLLFLAESYVPSRRGIVEAGSERLEVEKARLGVDISPVGRAAQERRSRETYSTTYKGRRVNLDMHVKGSNDRDPRHAFRVYFHWHDDDQRVVVGWLPGHLDNGMT